MPRRNDSDSEYESGEYSVNSEDNDVDEEETEVVGEIELESSDESEVVDANGESKKKGLESLTVSREGTLQMMDFLKQLKIGVPVSTNSTIQLAPQTPISLNTKIEISNPNLDIPEMAAAINIIRKVPSKALPVNTNQLTVDQLLIKGERERDDVFKFRSDYSKAANQRLPKLLPPPVAVVLGEIMANKVFLGVVYSTEVEEAIAKVDAELRKVA